VSGTPEARDAAEILAQLGDSIEVIIDGGAARGGPASTVVDCTADPPRVLRIGAVATDRVAAVLDGAGVAHGRRCGRGGRKRRPQTGGEARET
jgi:tRNA A37 threonylcarbamoyladenosine synthetase subunit TsaC/SUA5/YrdC